MFSDANIKNTFVFPHHIKKDKAQFVKYGVCFFFLEERKWIPNYEKDVTTI